MDNPLDAIWNSLPVPAVVLDAKDQIIDINPAAEGFFNLSRRAVQGEPLWDRLMVDAPLEKSFQRARGNATPLFVNDVDVGTGNRPPMQCNLKSMQLNSTSMKFISMKFKIKSVPFPSF